MRGTRISVALLLENFAAGMTGDEIAEAYPSLTVESIQGVMSELARQQKTTVA